MRCCIAFLLLQRVKTVDWFTDINLRFTDTPAYVLRPRIIILIFYCKFSNELKSVFLHFFLFLGPFANLRKTTISFVMSVCPSE